MDSEKQKRLEQSLRILLIPEEFKICEGCDSIVTIQTAICPSCKSYRYNEEVEDVINHCKLLVGREQRSVTEDDLF